MIICDLYIMGMVFSKTGGWTNVLFVYKKNTFSAGVIYM